MDNDEDTYVGDVTQGCPTTVDCDDSDETTYPGAAEACDNVDNNCDGEVDEGCSAGVEDAPPNTSQEQAPLVPPNCELGDATFLDSAGTVADIASEGDSLFLSVSATSCENAEVSFIVLEYDGNDPLTGELLVDVVDDAAVALVLNGVAAVEWPVSYVDDELEYDAYGFEDSFPEYLLFAAIDREEGVIAANPSEILKVVAWGEGEVYSEEDLYDREAEVTRQPMLLTTLRRISLKLGIMTTAVRFFLAAKMRGLRMKGCETRLTLKVFLLNAGMVSAMMERARIPVLMIAREAMCRQLFLQSQSFLQR